ncbi:hypothetical protein [Sorangium sp. So ce385]|uniref:hypothetical protein n=1 Tax=Sorangium sp. So ce385 TaxID=3133308 RepID=UPI003F5B048D
MTDLERRLSQLEEKAERSDSEEATPSEGSEPRVETREEVLARKAEWHRSRLEAHRIEPTDSAWSAQSARSIQEGLRAVRGDAAPFDVVSVDCKTTLCVATLDWADYDKTRAASSQVLHHVYEPNCGVEFFNPPPEQPEARYQSQVIFDCTEARTP